MIVKCSKSISGECKAKGCECEHAVNHKKITNRCGGWKKCLGDTLIRCVKVAEE